MLKNIVEGKKGIDAQITAPGLVAVARQTLDPHIIAFCPEFPWWPDEFIMLDDLWVDLTNHLKVHKGYFYNECIQPSNHKNSKEMVFKSRSFTLYVVVPQSQWVKYQQFVAKWDGVTAEIVDKSKPHPGPSGRCSRPSSSLGPSGWHSRPSSSFLPSPNDSSSNSSPMLSSTLVLEQLAGSRVATSHNHPQKLSTRGDLVSGKRLFLDEEDGNREVFPEPVNKVGCFIYGCQCS